MSAVVARERRRDPVVTSTSPAAARAHSRAAMFSADAAVAVLHRDRLAAVDPHADGQRELGVLDGRLAAGRLELERRAHGLGADSKTASASSPRSSITLPPRASTVSRARSANFFARRAAVSSPRSRVNVE